MNNRSKGNREIVHHALESIGDGVIITDINGRISIMNLIAEKLTGWERKNAKGRSIYKIFILEGNASNENIFQEVLCNWNPVGLYSGARLVSKDGSKKYISLSGSPIRDDMNRVIGMVMIFRDIDKIVKNEEKLKILYTALEQGASSVLILDLDKNIQYVNPQFANLAGYTPELMEGCNIDDLLSNNYLNSINKSLTETMNSGKSWQVEVLTELQGVSYWEQVVITPLKEDEKTSHYLILGKDISSIKNVQQELQQAKHAAEAASKTKSDFLANISHEIRTPLNGIIGLTNLTLLSSINPEQKENLEIIKSCGDTLLNLINDILDFSKIEAGKINFEKLAFSISDLLHTTTAAHQYNARQKGLQLFTEIEADIPDLLLGDPYRLQQVLNNLISNAIKFSEHGVISLRINALERFEREIKLEFEVEDEGIGIAHQDLDKLFWSFSQLDTTATRRFGGTGLGLAISKKLVEMMRGNIWLNSEVGKGSTFHFTAVIGIADEDLKSKADYTESLNENNNLKSAFPLKILLAEDDMVSQTLMKSMLRSRNYQVDIANNGKEVLKALEQVKYDMIIMDINMPEMDGVETTIQIRKIEKNKEEHIPIIALTAHALYGDREKFLAVGMDHYLSKPVEINELYESIELFEKVIREPRSNEGLSLQIYQIEELYHRVSEISLDEMSGFLEDLAEAIEEADGVKAERFAHYIKDLAIQIEEYEMKSIAFKMELSIRKGEWSTVSDCFSKLEDKYEYLKTIGS